MSATCDAAGNIIRRSGVVQDITERKQREIEREQLREQLQRQEQLAAVGQLAAGIAHDFNNIMSVISIYAEMTSEAPGLTDKERARTLTIMEQTQRATRMIRQILDFSRQAVYERQVLDLLPLLKEADEAAAADAAGEHRDQARLCAGRVLRAGGPDADAADDREPGAQRPRCHA